MANPYSFHLRPEQQGVTLVELLVVLAITGILLAVAMPSLRAFMLESRSATATNLLVTDLHLVRSEAVKRAAPVTICKSPDGDGCVTSDGWDQGWLIFVDDDQDRELDPGEDVLRVREELADDFDVTFRAFGSRSYLTYEPTGVTRRNGTFYICGPRGGAEARAVILSKTGRLRVSRTKSDGSPISCP